MKKERIIGLFIFYVYFCKKQRTMKKIIFLIIIVSVIAVTIWWRAPIIGSEWNKQTLYVGLLDTWYGRSVDSKAYAMWIDDDSSTGVFKSKKIADSLGIPVYFAVIADKMEPEIADSLASWQRQGAGIILHGFRHEPWKEWNTIQIENDIRKSKQKLYILGFDTAQITRIIIPPHSCNTKTIRNVIKRHGYKMVSGATLINPDRQVFQYGRISISPSTDLDAMRELLEKAYKRNAFVIFATHSSISEHFSVEKTQEVLRISKEIGYCFNINE